MQASNIRHIVQRIVIGAHKVEVTLSKPTIRATLLGASQDRIVPSTRIEPIGTENIVLTIPARLKRRGGAMKLVVPAGASTERRPCIDAALTKALGRAFAWRTALESGRASSIVEIARKEQITARYISRLLPLAYLSPDIVESILDGTQPRHLTLENLSRSKIPILWRDQRRWLQLPNP